MNQFADLDQETHAERRVNHFGRLGARSPQPQTVSAWTICAGIWLFVLTFGAVLFLLWIVATAVGRGWIG